MAVVGIAVTACVFVVPPSTTIGDVLERVGTISGGDLERDFLNIHIYLLMCLCCSSMDVPFCRAISY